MQIKTSLRFHLTKLRMAFKVKTNVEDVCVDVKKK